MAAQFVSHPARTEVVALGLLDAGLVAEPGKYNEFEITAAGQAHLAEARAAKSQRSLFG